MIDRTSFRTNRRTSHSLRITDPAVRQGSSLRVLTVAAAASTADIITVAPFVYVSSRCLLILPLTYLHFYSSRVGREPPNSRCLPGLVIRLETTMSVIIRGNSNLKTVLQIILIIGSYSFHSGTLTFSAVCGTLFVNIHRNLGSMMVG